MMDKEEGKPQEYQNKEGRDNYTLFTCGLS